VSKPRFRYHRSSGDLENYFHTTTQTDLWIACPDPTLVDKNQPARFSPQKIHWKSAIGGRSRHFSENFSRPSSRPDSRQKGLFSPIRSLTSGSNMYAYERMKARDFHLPTYKQSDKFAVKSQTFSFVGQNQSEKSIDYQIEAYFDYLRLFCENQRDLLTLDEKNGTKSVTKSDNKEMINNNATNFGKYNQSIACQTDPIPTLKSSPDKEYFRVISEPSFNSTFSSNSLLRSTSLPTTCSSYSLKVGMSIFHILIFKKN